VNLSRRFNYAIQGFSQTDFFYGQVPGAFYDPSLSPFIDRDQALATRTTQGGSIYGVYALSRYRRLEVSAGFVNFNEEVIEFDETPAGVSEENIKLKKLLNMSVNEIELSVRAANCLNNANITTVGQLAQKTEAEMLKYRNFGKKSLNEIKDKLQQLGLSLGMKFDPGLVDLPVSGDGASPNGSDAKE